MATDPKKLRYCPVANCGYFYDPERGDRKGKIPKGVEFDDLPETWVCPVCGASKKLFEQRYF
ncbi:rubredoxin [Desulfovibrio litoralis]|uniref:Rubredoxin n=1 Tax=Desulfovibrio litoralis DSM 11393 TaxID=1121455 RepID=A0A1M7S8J2_9BACT|nr:rubredoxin [Desulfovibrio litoralis]SHN54811.1 Rubredoxin [Desulfovibrio litoralis DSM 11393]